MRLPILLVAASIAALASGCGNDGVRISSTRTVEDEGGPLKVIDTLQCPDTIGSLTRKGSAQEGGRVCTYGGPRGAEVSLHLVSLDGTDPERALLAFENELTADMPRTLAQMRAAQAEDEADAARREAESARDEADVARAQADDARAEAEASAGNEKASVRMPGMSVDADGDKASVRMPGMSVDADGDKARVRIGGFSIDADDGDAAVNISSDDESVSVQARDDAAEIRTRASGSATRMTYILTDDNPSDAGWRMVGYEARGPLGGPIVIATVRAKARNDDSVFDAAKELVALNVGE